MTAPRARLLVPHLIPCGGVRHIMELARGLGELGWEARVTVSGTAAAPADRDPRAAPWWRPGPPVDACPHRSLRPEPGEWVVTYGDAENEMFMASRWRGARLALLVLDWLAFRPARQMSYIRQPCWSAVLCSTPYLRGMLRSEAGVDACAVGAGVDRGTFHPEPVLRPGIPVLGTQASAIPNKGTADALRIAGILAVELGSDVLLAAYGSDAHRPWAERDVPPGVRATYISRPGPGALRTLYNVSDAWLCTSRSEGYGFPSLEAMACGCPVLTYRNGGHTAYLEDGVNGYSADVCDADALAARAAEIVRDPALRAELALGAVGTAAALSWTAAAGQMSAALLAAG